MIELRPYQQNCLDKIIRLIPKQKHILIQAATGAGKTIIFSALCRNLLEQWPTIKIGILVHLKEVVQQNVDKMQEVWPDAKIDIACSSTGVSVATTGNLIIGSIQTLCRRMEDIDKLDIVIIDEAHRIPPINSDGQYIDFINYLKINNSQTRFIGFTATPFRLEHGYIYGDKCKEGAVNLFDSLSHSIPIKYLQRKNFLCQYRAKHLKDMNKELEKVKIRGDYNIGELQSLMSKVEHLKSAVHAVADYASDRKHIVVFCVTIQHAEKLNKYFNKAGHQSIVIHSKISNYQRNLVLDAFKKNQARIICNVGVLTEGWDFPGVDCIVMCRPTESTALYIQMCGRGLRPWLGKTDLLILDLSGNCLKHGDLTDPVVKIPSKSLFKIKSNPIVKVCPNCFTVINSGYKQCPECKFVFESVEPKQEVNKRLKLEDVKWNTQTPQKIVAKIERAEIGKFTSKAGNKMLKIMMYCSNGGNITFPVNHFLDIEGNGSTWGHKNAEYFWKKIVQTDYPLTVDEAANRYGEILMSLPDYVSLEKRGEWWNVRSWNVESGDKI